MITKDGRDVRIENLTPDDYVVPKGEERSYHAVIEVVQYDPRTGRKLSRPRLQKFGKKAFESSVRDSLVKQGWTIKILYDPTEWFEAQKARAVEEAKAREKAQEEKFNAAVAAEVAKQLAALQGETKKKPASKKSAE